MKLRYPLSSLLLAALAATASSPARALDAACERVAAASEKKLAAPAFHDRKELTGMTHEMLLANGKLYQRDTFAGKPPEAWAPSPITVSMIKQGAATYRQLLIRCQRVGSDSVDGTATDVIGFSVKGPEGKPVEGKVWIGAADGLPYREESVGLKGQTTYRNVKVPQ